MIKEGKELLENDPDQPAVLRSVASDGSADFTLSYIDGRIVLSFPKESRGLLTLQFGLRSGRDSDLPEFQVNQDFQGKNIELKICDTQRENRCIESQTDKCHENRPAIENKPWKTKEEGDWLRHLRDLRVGGCYAIRQYCPECSRQGCYIFDEISPVAFLCDQCRQAKEQKVA